MPAHRRDRFEFARDERSERAFDQYWRLAAARATADPRLGEIALRQGFVLRCHQAYALGVPEAEIRRRVRAGHWHRAGYGVVAMVPAGPLSAAAMRACAAALVRPGHVISHRSAGVLDDLPIVSLPGTSRLGVERTVVDLARTNRGQGLVAADAGLRSGRLCPVRLAAALADAAGLPGISTARAVLAMASPLSESPLESLSRLFLADEGFPPPTLQAVIRDARDGWAARVDFLWPELHVVLEADGRLKYTDDALWEEK